MKRIVVDLSVVLGVLYGDKMCRVCMDELDKSFAYSVVYCSGWEQAWSAVRNSPAFSPSDTPIILCLNFLSDWQSNMLSTGRLEKEDFFLKERNIETGLQSDCSSRNCLQKGHNARDTHCYRLILVGKNAGVIIYNNLFSAPCPHDIVTYVCDQMHSQEPLWKSASLSVANEIRSKQL